MGDDWYSRKNLLDLLEEILKIFGIDLEKERKIRERLDATNLDTEGLHRVIMDLMDEIDRLRDD